MTKRVRIPRSEQSVMRGRELRCKWREVEGEWYGSKPGRSHREELRVVYRDDRWCLDELKLWGEWQELASAPEPAALRTFAGDMLDQVAR